MEDEQIIELYWSRDEQAISETDRKYGPWCTGIAMRILQQHEESEECVNDTYLKTWNSIPPHRPNLFRAWLGKITRNLALDRYRMARTEKRGGGQIPLALEELQECISDRFTVEQTAEDHEIIDALNRFLAGLPAQQRNLFLRRYWHVDSIAEIAAAYGMTQSNVATILFRCRKALRAQLEKEGIAL